MNDDENVGRLLADKYELVRLVGRGGMGAVYEGRTPVGKRVAIKLLVGPEVASDTDQIARFLREAKTSAAVESRHVVDVYDMGVDDATGYPFIIMGYLDGEDLDHVMRRVGALDPIAAARIASQTATGLTKAHEAGIVHRDIKPANLFLAREDGESVVKILDFGVAKLGQGSALAASDHEVPLTRSGAFVGTPLYMSPEQAQGLKTIDARSDVWSLGMCLYHLLAGRLPFAAIDTLGKVIVAIVTHEVPSLLQLAPWVRPELAAVVHQTLERDVGKRIPSARQLNHLLQPFVGGAMTLTPEILVGAREQLAARVSVLPDGTSSPTVATSPTSVRDTVPHGAAATTSGVSSARAASFTTPPRSFPIRTAAMAVAAIAVVAAGAFVVGRSRTDSSGAPSAVATGGARPVVSTASTPPVPSAAPATPATPAEEVKEGLLTLNMPAGYTVKVNGVVPAGPDATGAARLLADGKLALRGEFQAKFLVAVYDKLGKRVMVQDVYLYDDTLDPNVIDTTVGAVSVEKPKPRPSAPAASALPARF